MTTTHDDTATTWRDLSDQLTPEQIERLTDFERRWTEAGKLQERDESLLFGAREYAENNVRDSVMFGHLDWPEGATAVYPSGELSDGRWSREFDGGSRQVNGVTVNISGTQFADGTIERELSVSVDDRSSGPGGDLNAAQARALAANLIEAADELERLQ
jgi:hypothetical protein